MSDAWNDDTLSAYLDDELTPAERATFEAGLSADADVRAQLDEVAEVRALVRGLAAPVPPPGFVDDLLAASVADAATAPAVVLDLDAARTRRRGRARFAAIAGSAAAAVALVLAVALPAQTSASPALATEVRVHQAGAAASGDPVSALAPLTTPLRFGR